MTTLAEQKQRVLDMADELEELIMSIKEASEERLNEYQNEWGDRALDPKDPLVQKTNCARDAVEGAEDGLKFIRKIQANVIVMEDY